MRCNSIKDKFLIIPGYLVGLSCLFLITYRTALALLSDSKAITVYVNRFGEQYFDIIALIVVWIIVIIGLILLLRNLRTEKEPLYTNFNLNSKPKGNKIGFLGYFSKSSKDEQELDEE